MRLAAFFYNKPEIQFFASSEIVFHYSLENLIFLESIFLKISCSVFAKNGGLPDNAQYVIAPKLQLSHFSSYFSLITSGAINVGVPTKEFIVIASKNYY